MNEKEINVKDNIKDNTNNEIKEMYLEVINI